MKLKDMIKVIIQVSDELGYRYSEDTTQSKTRIVLEDGNQRYIVTPIKDLNTISIACSIFNIGDDIDETDRADMVNQFNLTLDCGTMVLLPDLDIENQFEMILVKEVYAISSSHLRKILSEVFNLMSKTKSFYMNALVQAMSCKG